MMMGYQPSICIYKDGVFCRNDNNMKRFLFWKYRPYCDDERNCKLSKSKYRYPGKPPMIIKIGLKDLNDDDIRSLLDDSEIRDMFVRVIRDRINGNKQ